MVSRRLCLLALGALALLPAAGGCRRGKKAYPGAEQAVLERRKAGLESLVKRAEQGPLIPFNQVLAIVDESLVQQLVSSALPFERTVKSQYQVTVESATVSFDDNFALVTLGGRVGLVSRADSTFADVAVYGALDVVELDPFTGVLRGRVKMIGLDARKVEFAGANRVNLRVPVRVDKGEGVAEFRFKWDSAGLANLVCKDFAFHDRLRGTILPASYSVAGHFVLSATSSAIVANPRFADQKFHLRLDLAPESWARVKRAIEEQDSFGKCGVAIDPPKIMEKLRGLGQKGFEVRIPRSLVRPVTLPASVEQQVNVHDNVVALSVKPGVLGLDKDALLFSSSVSTTLAAMAIRPKARTPPAGSAN